MTMRWLGCRDDISRGAVRKEMERSIMAVIPGNRPGEFNQALMELGEVVCIPNGMPLCGQCPAAEHCAALASGRQTEFPVKPEKRARRIEKKTILVLEWDGKLLIRRRPETGLLAGMWEFPVMEGHLTMPQLREILQERGAEVVKLERMESGKHIFSHVEWHMRGYRIALLGTDGQEFTSTSVWADRAELQGTYAIPAAFRSFLNQL